ncbi:hypothetical protein ACIRP3_00990 [Streptomyces sp. NPDC101209]|uniref:hypothetical protein n=1 Tax=Streptomyces sp. NPDC101209 TaxID=3366129 RepID=UPI00381B3FEC
MDVGSVVRAREVPYRRGDGVDDGLGRPQPSVVGTQGVDAAFLAELVPVGECLFQR